MIRLSFENKLSFLVLISLLFFLYSNSKINKLPDSSDIKSELFQEPEQSDTDKENFILKHFDKEYVIQPLYQYELKGMIVSHNNISSITDAYHSSKSVDFRDLCVVWGDNLRNEEYKKIKFWSEPWSCHYRYSGDTKFNGSQLSNNHLLAEKDYIRKKINSAKIGDQIKLRGRLVNYFPKGFSEQLRETSTTRLDTGNGACEVIFVESFKVLKKSHKVWSIINIFFKNLFYLSLILKVLSFILIPQIEYRKMLKE